MTTDKKPAPAAKSAFASTNFTQFFKEEKDIYVQNLSTGQVSLQFGNGDDAQGFTLTRSRDPVNLTNHVPFKKIADSTLFRKMLSRKPAILRIMDEEEYQAYFTSKAKANKTTVEEVISAAESKRAGYKEKAIAPPKTTAPADDDTKEKKDEEPTTVAEVINPRVIHLCHQASSKEIPEAERMKPADLLQEFKDIQGELKFDDLEYISAHTTNKTVKAWVLTCQKEITEQQAS